MCNTYCNWTIAKKFDRFKHSSKDWTQEHLRSQIIKCSKNHGSKHSHIGILSQQRTKLIRRDHHPTTLPFDSAFPPELFSCIVPRPPENNKTPCENRGEAKVLDIFHLIAVSSRVKKTLFNISTQ
jgi:hypothetical protein